MSTNTGPSSKADGIVWKHEKYDLAILEAYSPYGYRMSEISAHLNLHYSLFDSESAIETGRKN